MTKGGVLKQQFLERPLSIDAKNCEAIAAVSFPMPLSASGARHIRIWEQRRPNQLPATSESGTSDVRVWEQRRPNQLPATSESGASDVRIWEQRRLHTG